eukprot:Blabericola_migrator_1__2656@NODE_1752_length_3856_cov_389_225653_g1129_i0_p2_GENE_NODE_1752_length_3856_cov_389_225653_g1129_i0NODE_1752_length_3856_cov_389_225653_g1129_i0_p2_ORF_typecomplete_len245_score36_44_NODE_1752_length_3856_cov_389_225653_g1129_i029073641
MKVAVLVLTLSLLTDSANEEDAAIKEQYPWWEYDWTYVLELPEFRPLITNHSYVIESYECPKPCCETLCHPESMTFEECLLKLTSDCHVDAKVSTVVRSDEYLCAYNDPDYIHPDYTTGMHVEWDASWIPVDIPPYALAWNVTNECDQVKQRCGWIVRDHRKTMAWAPCALDSPAAFIDINLTSTHINTTEIPKLIEASPAGYWRFRFTCYCYGFDTDYTNYDMRFFFNISFPGMHGKVHLLDV